jgi:cysteinyl-tRNA synthetase
VQNHFLEALSAKFAAGPRFKLKAFPSNDDAIEDMVNKTVHPYIEEMIAARLAARAAKNWAESDRIRDELAARGVALKDAKDPATGELRTTWEAKR